jgi:arsenite/tail-anchored protein-transporting ATPase
VQGVLDKIGMGGMMQQLSDLGLDELLNTPPPGLDEAIAISKVVEFVESASYARFTRIVFDTAPTGHTLRMLALPDFVAATLEKVRTLQGRLGGAGKVVAALFGDGGGEKTVARLRKLQDRVEMVAQLFRCAPRARSAVGPCSWAVLKQAL